MTQEQAGQEVKLMQFAYIVDGKAKIQYIRKDIKGKFAKPFWNSIESLTPIELFGVTPQFSATKCQIMCKVEGVSTATYSDDIPRNWQEKREIWVDVKKNIYTQIAKACEIYKVQA